MNHLRNELSPYLLQHAENPVDWYPWGEEAFARAREEDKPVFVSIGYSTCHWCHVMAHESFEDAEVGERMNQVFISVKVDREERPDVDAVYMDACQAMTGSGGWPLNVILTPQQKPFFAATYLPKHSRYGQWGLLELIDEIQRLWNEERQRIEAAGEQMTQWIQSVGETSGTGASDIAIRLSRALFVRTVEELSRRYDSVWGGFGKAPKFPMGHMLWFLLRFAQFQGELQDHDSRSVGWQSNRDKQGDGGRRDHSGGNGESVDSRMRDRGLDGASDELADRALVMARHTLDAMYRGGIYDHLGGGFSRYSTDEKWLVPHFEKMLYDNALLASAYVKGWELTGDEGYRRVAEETLNYMINELRVEGGGFACGQDADSDGEEGKFYAFTEEEIQMVLGEKRGEAFSRRYGVTPQGNFEGKNVLNRLESSEEEESVADRALDQEDRHAMYEYRKNRCELHRDDKVLAAWNGLALAAFAAAYRVMGQERYLHTARELARFLKERMTDENGRLCLSWKDGAQGVDGQLSDYAFCAWGLLELYEGAWDEGHLEEACRLTQLAQELFMDKENGGYFMYSEDGEQLISRPKEIYDGAMPSGNSAMALVLNRLARLTGRTEWIEAARRQNQWLVGAAAEVAGAASDAASETAAERNAVSGAVGEAVGMASEAAGMDERWALTGCTFGASALLEELYPSWELICVTSERSGTWEKELTELSRRLRRDNGNGVILVKNHENELVLAKLCPMTVNYPLPGEGTQYYYCRDGVCRTPVDSGEKLLALARGGGK